MTFEEAKKIFLNRGYIEVPGGTYYDADKWRNAVAIISKYLEQQPCEDCISREALKRKLQEHHDFFIDAYDGFSNMSQNDKSRVDEIINCIAMVVNEPSVTPNKKIGHWIEENINEWSRKVFCSKCGCTSPFEHINNGDIYSASGYGVINKTKFCPNCGANMIEPQESEASE